MEFTVIPSSNRDKRIYTNHYIAGVLDRVGCCEEKSEDSMFHYADMELATLAIADGFQPENQSRFDVVYCPFDAFRTGISSFPKGYKFPDGEYIMPLDVYLEPNAHIAKVLDNTYGNKKWRIVPIAYEHEDTNRPGFEHKVLGYFTRCAVLVKK